MNSEFGLNNNRDKLSVKTVSAILFWYLVLWASLTVITFTSQLLGISFKHYLYISLVATLAILVSSIARFLRYSKTHAFTEKDGFALFSLVILFIATATISLSYHTAGSHYLDDFYLTANPVYYSQTPQSAMSFESRTFYSGGSPIISAAFLTAGAYEHILALPSYLLHVDYIIIYYRLAAILNSLLWVLSTFMLLACFSENTSDAVAGTFVIICLLVIMSENTWASGGLAFVHVYEGKSVLIMDGIPILIAYSIDFFKRQTIGTWLQLLVLITAMTGMSTSSLMILPLFGAVIFLSCSFIFKNIFRSLVEWFKLILFFFGAYIYLLLFGIFVSFVDNPNNALIFNITYPDQFSGYLNGFLASSTLPATVIVAILSFAVGLAATKGSQRAFLGFWSLLSVVLALNPMAAKILLTVFRGIYYRIFYIILNPLPAGIAVGALLHSIRNRDGRNYQIASTGIIILILSASTILIPSSLFLNPRYELGNWMPTDDLPIAEKILNITPEGVMLAPYPVSGTIRMISSHYPQMITRSDILSFYLGEQGRTDDASLRLDAAFFLEGQEQHLQAFTALINLYPEIQSVVFAKGGLAQMNSAKINDFLRSRGFIHRQGLKKYMVFWK